ncbi:hypothetical protein PR048_015376, partial [Dryococelus australis]
MPQLETVCANAICHLNDALPHFPRDAREYLIYRLPYRWIGRSRNDVQQLLLWLPRSPDLTRHDFVVWDYVKDALFVPPLPADPADLPARIITAFDPIDREMPYLSQKGNVSNTCNVSTKLCEFPYTAA